MTRTDIDELLALEKEWAESIVQGRVDRIDRLVAAEFTFSAAHHPKGVVERQEWLDSIISAYEIATIRFYDHRVQVFGNAAIVKCRCDQVARLGNRDMTAKYLMTDVWIRREGWQVVSRHSAQLPN